MVLLIRLLPFFSVPSLACYWRVDWLVGIRGCWGCWGCQELVEPTPPSSLGTVLRHCELPKKRFWPSLFTSRARWYRFPPSEMAPGPFSGLLAPFIGARKSKKYEKLQTEDPEKKRQEATQDEINRLHNKIVSFFFWKKKQLAVNKNAPFILLSFEPS